MARLPRYLIPGQTQHIIQRGNNRQPIFAADADFRFFGKAIAEAAKEHGLAVHAYVWMTNHIHLLATPRFSHSVSKVFQCAGGRYTRYFNFTYRRSGTLWDGRYRATVVDSERYLLTLMRYIELNPVRAAMVAHPGDYPWSSHRHYAQGAGADADWLTAHDEYLRLGDDEPGRRDAYLGLFDSAIPDGDLAVIRECTHKGWALGDERFRGRIEALAKRRAASKGVGRPRNPDRRR